MYTVKQLADLAGVSIRTLHYYDEIGLLKPTYVGSNGYRHYADEDLIRLQQILFFRELDVSLNEIKTILDHPAFDVVAALRAHREALRDKVKRLNDLIQTIDNTIKHLSGEITMSNKQLFSGFSEEEEKRYAKEARERWGDEAVDDSYKRWNSYSAAQKEQIMAEGGTIYTDLIAVMDQGPTSPAVQQIIARWHQHLRYFYEPTVERLRGLGQLYVEHPDFARNFRQIHPDLPEFLRESITHYVANLPAGE